MKSSSALSIFLNKHNIPEHLLILYAKEVKMPEIELIHCPTH